MRDSSFSINRFIFAAIGVVLIAATVIGLQNLGDERNTSGSNAPVVTRTSGASCEVRLEDKGGIVRAEVVGGSGKVTWFVDSDDPHDHDLPDVPDTFSGRVYLWRADWVERNNIVLGYLTFGATVGDESCSNATIFDVDGRRG